MKVSLLSEQLLLTLWVGSLLAIGYIAVPMAFATLGDVSLAGNYAGKLFFTVNVLGLGCATALLLTKIIFFGKAVIGLWRFWVIVLMLSLALLFSFYLQPEIAVIKLLLSQGNNDLLERFDLFHSLSRNMYLVMTILGVVLVISSDKTEV